VREGWGGFLWGRGSLMVFMFFYMEDILDEGRKRAKNSILPVIPGSGDSMTCSK
jgi:hypothetical protein